MKLSKWVLDASALLALLQDEPGSDAVLDAVKEGAAISTVNLSETAAKLLESGMSPADVRNILDSIRMDVVEFDIDSAYAAASLRLASRRYGLSIGDRCCLALAAKLGLTALTADKAWQELGLSVNVRIIR